MRGRLGPTPEAIAVRVKQFRHMLQKIYALSRRIEKRNVCHTSSGFQRKPGKPCAGAYVYKRSTLIEIQHVEQCKAVLKVLYIYIVSFGYRCEVNFFVPAHKLFIIKLKGLCIDVYKRQAEMGVRLICAGA